MKQSFKNATGLKMVVVAGWCWILSGCAATHTAVNKHDLDVQTKMSETVFLEPAALDHRDIWVDVRNTSDRPDFDMTAQIREGIQARGYRLVEDPAQAHYLLQVNVLQVGKMDLRDAEKQLKSGRADAADSAIAGAAVGAAVSGDGQGLLVGGLIGGVAGLIADALVKDVQYSVITDIQISERADQGTDRHKAEKTNTLTHWRKYQTRILSTANQANLEFKEASQLLVAGLTRSISGIF